LNPLNNSLLSNGFTAGTPKFVPNFDPSAADVVRAANYSEDSMNFIVCVLKKPPKAVLF
jgi:hypothetical protein